MALIHGGPGVDSIFALVFAPSLKNALDKAPLSATLAAAYLGLFLAAGAYFSWAFVLSPWSAQCSVFRSDYAIVIA